MRVTRSTLKDAPAAPLPCPVTAIRSAANGERVLDPDLVSADRGNQ
jgi:hypothetical protein